MTLDAVDLRTALVGLLWIRRHRELHRQPPSPSIERALEHLACALAANGQAPQPTSRELLTTAEVAKRLGCSQRTARRIAARYGTRHGRQWLTPADRLPED
jgi:hypothetical protein